MIFFYLKILTLFKTVSKLTPVSATMANQIGAIPSTPRVRTIAFNSKENRILLQIIKMVFRAILIAFGMVER